METEGVAEGCVSRPLKDSSEVHRPKSQQKQREDQYRLDVFHDVLTRLREAGLPESFPPSFEEELWNHFHRLPACYAMDVNVHRAEDVLTHMKLLEQAQDPDKRPAIAVRLLQANPAAEEQNESQESSVHGGENVVFVRKRSLHHPPSLGSLATLEALPIEHNKHHHDKDGDFQLICRPMHEITISTVDKPKLLNLLTSLFAELGLNIKEAHAFSTNDGFSLDVFFVDGWPHEILDNSELYKYRWLTCLNRLAVKESELLEESLQKKFQKNGKDTWSRPRKWTPTTENEQSDKSISPNNVECLPNRVKIPRDGIDEWELDPRLLEFGKKVASGSFGDLYRGSYCSQDVAIKILNPERVHVDLQKEFAQEVFIMRKIRHKNVVQFIGACTKLPSLCIVTEFMSKGSVYDFLHKNGNIFRLPVLVRVATDVANGMNYLHQNNIIHRDLKSSNLLMDENEIVKVADFGVARVKSPTGVMTAETGTYRWMAPEVIEHLPYDHKADVFSFGVVLWELLTGKLPHEDLTPLQAALGVVQKGLRPKIPEQTHPSLSELIKSCWQQNPDQRPDFMEIIKILESISVEVSKENGRKKSSSGFLPFFKRSLHSLG